MKTPIKRVRLDEEQIQIDTPVHKQQPEEHGMRRSIDAVTDDLWLIKIDLGTSQSYQR